MHAAELGLRGSWRCRELSVPGPEATGLLRPQVGVGPQPRSLPYSVAPALEDPSPGLPGWRPTAWAAPEDSEDGKGAFRWSPRALAAPLTAPHCPAVSLWGPVLGPLQMLSGDSGASRM